jgi:hypothetical protein
MILPDKSEGDTEFYQKKFLCPSGLLISMSPAADASVMDGSATLLRKDASWKTWWEDDYHHPTGISVGFAWADNTIIKCGYPMDADSLHRELNGIPDRCGNRTSKFGLNLRALLVLEVLILSCTVGALLRVRGIRTETACSVGALTAMGSIVLWWVIQWRVVLGRFESSIERSDPQACVDAVLERARSLYGCPRNHTHILFAIIVACVALAAGVTVSSICSFSHLRAAVACTAAVTASWAAIGFVKRDSILSPFGVRTCAQENEFVINRGRDAVHIDKVTELYNFPLPSALVVFCSPKYTFDKAHFEAIRAVYDENATQIFTITFNSEESTPMISKNVLLKDIHQLFP